MNEASPARAAPGTSLSPDWIAEMVRPVADAGVGTPSTFLRKQFELAAPGGREVLRISALGLYRAFINGVRVGNDLLTPGWTSYDKRLSFQTYEVGTLLRQGINVIDIWLADGWYRSQMMWARNPIFNTWGSEIAAIAELREAPGADAVLVVKTDASWASGELPVRKSGIYFGEIYDARLETLEANSGSEVIAFDTGLLVPHETAAVHELEPFLPVLTWKDAENRILYDFGQNLAGYVAFKVKGEAGAKFIVEHSEIIDRDNSFDNRNYRTADARVEYISRAPARRAIAPSSLSRASAMRA